MITTRLAVKLLWFSSFLLLIFLALLQWCKYFQQCSDFQIRAVVPLVMLSIVSVYCFSMMLLLSYFAGMFFPYYVKNMGESGRKYLTVWKIVLTKEKYLAFQKSYAGTK